MSLQKQRITLGEEMNYLLSYLEQGFKNICDNNVKCLKIEFIGLIDQKKIISHVKKRVSEYIEIQTQGKQYKQEVQQLQEQKGYFYLNHLPLSLKRRLQGLHKIKFLNDISYNISSSDQDQLSTSFSYLGLLLQSVAKIKGKQKLYLIINV
ncbi:unnamed protein product [Paramecium pentaurelia]|uniref:Uncharacterized protein n=1 Tax=Paramecium pentaurelia TaxID=43138 RepID=A0A8S1X0C3_9CILI|nr:unnamed protein product [Paramecium pentaurelia]